ncbi:MAG: hypothetical protein MUC36_17465 [Planctomycetes bacterium]|nr:hypothetical protein [Planctomycetota bacterium]
MTDAPEHWFGAAVQRRPYGQELLLDAEGHPSSRHALQCLLGSEPQASVILGASGGATGVHEHSCVVFDDRCCVVIGDWLVALALPGLALLWKIQADEGTCFGVHRTPDQCHVVVHGELSIRKFTLDGRQLWSFAGKDIFTGGCVVEDREVVVTDFAANEYRLDLDTGEMVAGPARTVAELPRADASGAERRWHDLWRWLLLLPVTYVACAAVSLLVSLVAELLRVWTWPWVGAGAAATFVLVPFWMAPRHQRLVATIAFVGGAVLALRLVGRGWYPAGYGELAYTPTCWPIVAIYGGGLLALLCCWLRRRG